MNHLPEPIPVSRRSLLIAGLVVGAGFMVPGCRSKGQTSQAGLPDPLWPDQQSTASKPLPDPGATIAVPLSGDIIPRSAWAKGGQRTSGDAHAMNGVRRITIHHTAMDANGLDTKSEVATMLDRIRKEHLRRNTRFVDIGYHYIIDPQGRVWEGRSLNLQGAHVADQNEHNLGISLMGNFDIQRPTPAQVHTLNAFVPQQMRRYSVRTASLFTHQELGASRCPGINLQQIMVAARSRGGSLTQA